MLGNLFGKIRHVGGKALGIGGNVLKKIGQIGGQAVKTIGDYGGLIGTAGGGVAAAITGNPAMLMKGSQMGAAAQNFANSKATQNVIRGISDVGNSASSAGQYLRK